MSTASSGEMSTVLFIPCGVMSKTHERTAEITKPNARSTTTTFIIQGGALNVGRKIDAAWTNSHETTTYAAATLYTFRRFNSAKNLLAFVRKVRALLRWAGMSFIEVMSSQLMPSAEDVRAFWPFGIIEIELSIHSSGISVLGLERVGLR